MRWLEFQILARKVSGLWSVKTFTGNEMEWNRTLQNVEEIIALELPFRWYYNAADVSET